MAAFTRDEYVDIVYCYAFCGSNESEARREYEARYPERRIPDRRVFGTTYRRLRATGGVDPRANFEGSVPAAGAGAEAVRLVETYPTLSTRRVAGIVGLSQSSVWKTLKRERMHPYHYSPVQELIPPDCPKRMDFCNWLIGSCGNDPSFLEKILWTDESQFTKNGVFNYHNEHQWSRNNPHAIRVESSQHRFSVNVWAGILGNRIVGPHFFEGTLNANLYFNFLRNDLPELLEDVPLTIRTQLIFQQDGAPPHYGRIVTDWLNENFQDKWIGRNGPILWPPRSPDLTPLDFYLWGRLKSLVYTVRIESIHQLKERILQAFATVKEEMEAPGFDLRMVSRATACLSASGRNFEHI